MQKTTLLLEVGEEAMNELSDNEQGLILNLYDDSEARVAAMRVFDILRKKFKPSYRMGSFYEDRAAKYRAYDNLYKEYASSVGAGKLGAAITDVEIEVPVHHANDIDRNKWTKLTR
jgi:hypothetical protein